MPTHSESYWKKLYPHLFKPYRPLIGPQGASQLGFRVRDRSNRTGQPNLNQPRMPQRSASRKRAATRSPARAFRRRGGSSRKRVFRKKSSLGDTHSFKGIINAGILAATTSATSTHLGGQYIFKLTDLPIYNNMNTCFDFCRLNRCRMEFMPRFNMQSANNAPTGITGTSAPQTFMTGLDEIPIYSATNSALTVAPTWLSQGDEDAGVTEAMAYDHLKITPDYLRGIETVKETEVYKKHNVGFNPVFYNYLLEAVATAPIAPGPTQPVYQRNTRKWLNLNALNQTSGTEVAVSGPDFYGPMYAFGNNVGSGGATTQYYDVKLHYSISFRRLKGF